MLDRSPGSLVSRFLPASGFFGPLLREIRTVLPSGDVSQNSARICGQLEFLEMTQAAVCGRVFLRRLSAQRFETGAKKTDECVSGSDSRSAYCSMEPPDPGPDSCRGVPGFGGLPAPNSPNQAQER
jgi:hypothetical protein